MFIFKICVWLKSGNIFLAHSVLWQPLRHLFSMLLNLADCCFIFLPCEINGGAILGHIRLGVNHFSSFFIDL